MKRSDDFVVGAGEVGTELPEAHDFHTLLLHYLVFSAVGRLPGTYGNTAGLGV